MGAEAIIPRSMGKGCLSYVHHVVLADDSIQCDSFGRSGRFIPLGLGRL
jgi:hypothetical protein